MTALYWETGQESKNKERQRRRQASMQCNFTLKSIKVNGIELEVLGMFASRVCTASSFQGSLSLLFYWTSSFAIANSPRFDYFFSSPSLVTWRKHPFNISKSKIEAFFLIKFNFNCNLYTHWRRITKTAFRTSRRSVSQFKYIVDSLFLFGACLSVYMVRSFWAI